LKLIFNFNFKIPPHEFVMHRLLFFLLLFCSALIAEPAPQDLVTIQGTVTDKTQAVVPGASVVLQDEDGHTFRKTSADDAGNFRIENVPTGAYLLRVDLKGFESKSQKIFVSEGRAIAAQVELDVEKVTETVTVTAEAIYNESQAVTAMKMNVPLLDVPQSVSVVNNQLLRAQNVTSVQDALRNVPAVSVHLGEGRRDQVLIRGFSALNDQYVDGVRDDSPYYRDLSSVERIEVLKGPAAVLYGRGSAGGVVNRVMKKAELEQPLAFEFATTVGSYGQKRMTTDIGTSFLDGKLATRLTGAYEDSNSFRHFYGLDRYDFAPSFLLKISDRSTLSFQAEHLYDSRLPDRGIPSLNGRPAPVDLHDYYGYPEDDFIRNRVNTQALNYEHRFTHWTLRNSFRHSGYDNIFSNTQPNGINANGTVRREQYNVNSGQGNFFNQTDAVFGGRFAKLTHTALLGLEYGHQTRDTARFTGSAGSVALNDPVLTQPKYSTTPATYNEFTGNVVGLYFNDQITIHPKWKASLGARYDYYDQSLNDLLPADRDLARTDHAFSPRAGLVYQPLSWTSIYGSYSRSFQPSGEGLSLAVNNQELEPETSENFEVGSKFDLFQRKLSTTFAVFRLNRSNVKTIDPNDSSKLVLAGEQRTNGFEWTFAGTLRRGWDIYGGYAYLDSKIIKTNDANLGNRIAHVAPHAVNFWSTYAFGNGFGFGGGVIYNDDRYAGNDNIVQLPEYTRVDATMFWKKRKYDVVLNLRNIGSVSYYESAHSNNQIMPGAPVNGSLTVRYRW
jgi:catecholate siderophore receptor